MFLETIGITAGGRTYIGSMLALSRFCQTAIKESDRERLYSLAALLLICPFFT